jgi:hypothetical protein
LHMIRATLQDYVEVIIQLVGERSHCVARRAIHSGC